MLLDADVISCLASEVQPSAAHPEAIPQSCRQASLLGTDSRQDSQSVECRPDAELHQLALDDDPAALHHPGQNGLHQDPAGAAACSRQADSSGGDCSSASGNSDSDTPKQLTAAELVQRAHDRAAALRWTQKGLAVSVCMLLPNHPDGIQSVRSVMSSLALLDLIRYTHC